MNPNYLLRDELQYELASRGLNSSGDVQFLRKILRVVLADGVPSLASYLAQSSFDDLYRCACSKLGELEALYNQLEKGALPPVSRMRTRIAHFWNRIRHLEDLCPEVAGNQRDEVSSLAARLAAVEREFLLPGNDVCDLASEDGEQQPNGNTTEGREQDMPKDGLGISANTVSSEADQQLRGRAFSSHFCVGRDAVTQFNSSIFSKLPHPIEGLLKRLPRINGLQVDQLLVFLTEVIRIRDLSMLTDVQLLELIFPYCLDALAGKVMAALQGTWEFERLHREILECFIPRRLFEQLRREKYERLQRDGETFATYICSVKDAARVLRLPVSERDVVNNIIEGLAPTQRSSFVFQAMPTNYRDLDQLAILDQNLTFANRQREAEIRRDVGRRCEAVGCEGRQYVRPEYKRPTEGRFAYASKRCYRCKEVGHLQRDCPRGKARR